MVECKTCGKQNPSSSIYCQECGSKIKRFGEFSGNRLIDTIIWIVIVMVIVGLFNSFILGPLFSVI